MLIDPKTVQWVASLLLVLSGVQNLVIVGRGSSGMKLRLIGGLIALAAIGFGVWMIINLMGVRI